MGVTYALELFNSGSGFGPGVRTAEVWDARNVGWAWYDRLASPAFFTVPQGSPILSLIDPLLTHLRVWRIDGAGETLVWSGVVADLDRVGDDVIVAGWNYLALLGVSRSGYGTLYPNKKLGSEIVSPEWTAARTVSGSPLAFVGTGVIEDPVGTDGVTPITTNAEFGTLDQMRLQLFWDLSEIGRANTGNYVTFGITRTPPHTFSFVAAGGVDRDVELTLGSVVDDYHYLPSWRAYRNDLAALNLQATGGAGEITAEDASEIAARGRRQDVFVPRTLLGLSGTTTETDQLRAALDRELVRRTKVREALQVTLVPGALRPFDGWDVGDTLRVAIENGSDVLDGRWRCIGVRALTDADGEHAAIFLAPVGP